MTDVAMTQERFSELIGYIYSGQLMKFYKSKEWKALRLKALKRDNNECQACKRLGKYKRAQCVHHLKEVKVVPTLSLTLSNLECLCNACHNKEHDRHEAVMRDKGKRFMNEERW